MTDTPAYFLKTTPVYSPLAFSLYRAAWTKAISDHDTAVTAWSKSRWLHGGRRCTCPDSPVKRYLAEVVRGVDGQIGFRPCIGTSPVNYAHQDRFLKTICDTLIGFLPEDIRHKRNLRCKDIERRCLIAGIYATGKEVAALYEVLKGRDINRLKKIYGAEVVEAVTGHPDNLLLVQRRKTLLAEIAAMDERKTQELKDMQDAYMAALNELSKKNEANRQAVAGEYDAKIADLQAQLEALSGNPQKN